MNIERDPPPFFIEYTSEGWRMNQSKTVVITKVTKN